MEVTYIQREYLALHGIHAPNDCLQTTLDWSQAGF